MTRLAILLFLYAAPALAEPSGIDMRLQMLVADSGLRIHVRDQAAMLHGIDRLAARSKLTVAATINEHVSEFKYGWRAHRRWIPRLTVACEKPEGFARVWEGEYQTRCFQIVRLIRRYLAGKVPNPCNGCQDQWRKWSHRSNRTARLKGYGRVACGRLPHKYWNTRGMKCSND